MPNPDFGMWKDYQQLAKIRSGGSRVADRQIWAVGCSITHGVGVATEQTWKHLVSNTLALPYTDLSASGSSVLWQSDQICQSQIQSGDLVLWAITVPPRLPVIRDQDLFHLTPGEYHHDPQINQEFPIDLLTHPTLVYHNIQAVRRAENICKLVGARLIVQSVLYDFDNARDLYGVRDYCASCSSPDQWQDLGTDSMHPGPKQHGIFAKTFLTLIDPN